MNVPTMVSLLIIDDAEDDAALILRALKTAGVAVKHHRVDNDASLAVALAENTFDAVICDFNLPSYSAFAALDRVRQSSFDLPFLVVSGSVGEDIAVELIKRGANDFVPKQHLGRVPIALQREIRERGIRVERQRVERALAESRERFRVLVASMEDIVFSLDREHRIEQLYGRGVASFGVEPQQLVGKTLAELVGPERAGVVQKATEEALKGQVGTFEWVAASGRNFSVTVSPLQSADEVIGVVGLAREITAQKREEAQAVLADRMASIGTLAAGVAHEINNPLASIHSNLSFITAELRELARSLNEEQREQIKESFAALGDAVDATGRVRDIVRDLKLFSRDREEEEAGPVDVGEVIDSSLRMARNEIRHRARLVNDVKPVPRVMGTASRIGQVVLNLLVNAAQAIADGHAATNEIRVSTEVEGGFVVIGVSDTGAGMTEETKKRLFTPFFTTKPVGEGTGLGLSICYRIVTDMGGRIRVDSAPGAGAKFRIWLPIATGSNVTVEAQALAPESNAPFNRLRVLVIDDEPMIAKAIERALGKLHRVESSLYARAALERVRSEGFDVVLCDMMMPDMNGMEFHAALTQLNPGLARRVIFLTGGAFTDASRRFLEEHETMRLEKPFEIAKLLRMIERTVQS